VVTKVVTNIVPIGVCVKSRVIMWHEISENGKISNQKKKKKLLLHMLYKLIFMNSTIKYFLVIEFTHWITFNIYLIIR